MVHVFFPGFQPAGLRQTAMNNKALRAKPQAALISALRCRNCSGNAEQAGTISAVPF